MIDHVSIAVSDLERSKAFYLEALKPLGIDYIMGVATFAGFGANGKPFFWIGAGAPKGDRGHVAFAADKRSTVDKFHAAALAAGGKDNGPPGLRPQYHANYYGAFVLDPDGHNIEAVCHR
jgi:catechol 2,3-dioxygenase-like lactoylglutathione lyase family enzyme